MVAQAQDPDFEALLEYLSASRGFDFTAYKRSTLMRRTLARMQTLNLASYSDYMDLLQVDPEEFDRFFDTILINVTAFFRDPPAWELVAKKVIPAIIERRGIGEIRVWSAACASGEEAYSLAILFAEALGLNQAIDRVKIYATDLDEEALRTARAGLYAEKAVAAVPEELRERYFERQGDAWCVKRDIRRLVIFGRHDLLKDAPISRVDLVVCRNTLMYFNAESQRKVLERFFFALRDGGYLFLGKAETLLTRRRDVVPIDLKLRVFEVPRGVEFRTRLLVSAGDGMGEPVVPDDRIREKAFDLDPLAQIVIDQAQTLVLINDNARRLFGLRDLDIGRPLQDLEASYRPVELRPMIDRAVQERRTISVREVNWPLADGTPRWITPQAIPLVDQGGFLGVKLVFTDVTAQKALQAEIEASHAELETAYEELQSANEELETTNEELHSTIEELETTNEELQSTNEELETTNEELESANEELHTVNEVMRDQTEGLDRANSYLSAILGSLGAGVIVVNRNMEVQIWNRQAEEQWGLRSEEVQGVNLLSLDFGLPVDQLIPALRECLADSDSERTEVVRARNRRGYPVECTISCRPFHLDGSAPQGAILLIRERALKEDRDGETAKTVDNS